MFSIDKDRFKFKVYHKPSNRMYDLAIFSPNNTSTYVVDNEDEDAIILEAKDCILLQSTGLKDVNGNLIYEGDVICHILNDKERYAYVEYYQIPDYEGYFNICHQEYILNGEELQWETLIDWHNNVIIAGNIFVDQKFKEMFKEYV